MPCKQSELITAINSFAAARSSNDQVLTSFSANLVAKLMDTLVFAPEDEVEETPEQTTAETPAEDGTPAEAEESNAEETAGITFLFVFI